LLRRESTPLAKVGRDRIRPVDDHIFHDPSENMSVLGNDERSPAFIHECTQQNMRIGSWRTAQHRYKISFILKSRLHVHHDDLADLFKQRFSETTSNKYAHSIARNFIVRLLPDSGTPEFALVFLTARDPDSSEEDQTSNFVTIVRISVNSTV
jgi:hypothetical protein